MLDPDDLYKEGAAHYSSGSFEEAARSLEMAIEADPLFVEARYLLGEALRKAARYQEAVESYDAALDLKPDHPGAGGAGPSP